MYLIKENGNTSFAKDLFLKSPELCYIYKVKVFSSLQNLSFKDF